MSCVVAPPEDGRRGGPLMQECATSERVVNVHDRRHGWIGEWEAEPLIYERLNASDIGRTVIYRCQLARKTNGMRGSCEAGTLTSFRDGLVFARYNVAGRSSAAANPCDLVFGTMPRDGEISRKYEDPGPL